MLLAVFVYNLSIFIKKNPKHLSLRPGLEIYKSPPSGGRVPAVQGRCSTGRRDKALVQRLVPEKEAFYPSVRLLDSRWPQSLKETRIKPEGALYYFHKSDFNSSELSPRGGV